MSRTYTYLAALVGVVCGYFLISSFVFGRFFVNTRTVRNDVVQGILIGFGLAFVTAQIYARIKATKVNGWITMFGLGEPRMPNYFPALSTYRKRQCIGGRTQMARAMRSPESATTSSAFRQEGFRRT